MYLQTIKKKYVKIEKKALMKRNINNFSFKLLHTTPNEVVYVNIFEYRLNTSHASLNKPFNNE